MQTKLAAEAMQEQGRMPSFTMEQKRTSLYALCAVLDILAIILGFHLGGEVRSPRWLSVMGIPLVAGAVPVYLAFALVYETYSVACLNSLSEATRRTLAALGATAFVLIAFAFFAQIGEALSRVAFFYAILSSAFLLVAGRAIVANVVRWFFDGVTVLRLVIIDGGHCQAEHGCDVFYAAASNFQPDLFNPQQLERVGALVAPYDQVILCCSTDRRAPWITALKATGTSVEMIVPQTEIQNAVALGRYGENDTLILSRGPLSLSSRFKKRAVDLALTLPVLILIAPLLLIVALIIRFESPGPALFKQPRIGLGNRPFMIYKFRSMRSESCDVDGVVSTQRDDDRITRFGQFIRRTSIDELPQLFNVLIGNMSLVGPRPHAFASTAGNQLFWEVSQRYWMRHALKPGITGLAQIRGFRGATERAEDLEQRLRCDLEYLEHWSLWRDLTILIATIKVVSHKNAF